MIGIGIIGLGNVFEGPYRTELAPLIRDGHVKVHAVYDHATEKRAFAAEQYGISADLTSPDEVIDHPDVELVLILAAMPAHGELAEQALAAGKHMLVEKPMATDLGT
ncbi:MAG: Gfo/Idh/MocA family oxidoreductase, partial [Thermoleophilia bacterium]|nr:Gfo/Idh/MocA family oxidoreductase [Thermoleophilia bacterium]